MDELKKNEKLGDLYAYYGSLLTANQQDYFEEYYYDDLSLGEIADNHQVTRQAVFDNLKRSTKILENFEDQLHMRRDYNKIEDILADAVLALDNQDVKAAKTEILKLLNQMRGE